MVNISHIVGKLIKQKPFIQEALSKGIINNAALAETLIPKIERELNKKVKFSAVNMAIRRHAEKLQENFVTRTKFSGNSDLTMKSNLIEITFYKSTNIGKHIKQLYSIVDFRKGDILTITQGLNEVMIITNKKYEQKIRKIIPSRLIKKTIKNLTSITINLSLESIRTVGLFYISCRALNWENINIIDIVSTLTEMTFLVDEKDSSRSFDTLKEMLNENS